MKREAARIESGSGKQAERIRSTYAWWGKSGLYNPATAVTLLGRERMIRRQGVELLGLHGGDRVIAGLDVRWFNGGSLFIAAGRPLSLTGGQQP